MRSMSNLLTVFREISTVMDRWEGKVALVTGASSGIGEQVVRALAKNGMKVIAVARRLEKLKELAASIKSEFNGEVYPMTCDVRQEEEILKVFKRAEEELGGVDVLINNAGVILNEPIIGRYILFLFPFFFSKTLFICKIFPKHT